LNHLFKQMNDIVLEQGTIVDRIDYNIEKSATDTRLAKKELHKVSLLFFGNNKWILGKRIYEKQMWRSLY